MLANHSFGASLLIFEEAQKQLLWVILLAKYFVVLLEDFRGVRHLPEGSVVLIALELFKHDAGFSLLFFGLLKFLDAVHTESIGFIHLGQGFEDDLFYRHPLDLV